MAEIFPFWAFLPLSIRPQRENHQGMEIFGIVMVVLLLIALAATVSALLRDDRGQTPRATSDQAWSSLDLPSTNYTFRIF
jgi:hypothetical protein